MTLPPAIRGARAALIFLTRIPVGGFPYRPADWRWSTAYFPWVGLLLGAVLAGFWQLCAPLLGARITALLSVGLHLLLTGAFHEDGLADSADAMGGAFERERLLEILKDSRIGTFGAAALFCVLALRAMGLAELDRHAPLALLLSQCLARTPPIWLMVALPYATGEDRAKSRDVSRAQWPQALLASLWPAGLLAGLVSLRMLHLMDLLYLLAATTSVTLLCGWRFWRRAQGITGDFLGATEQVVEVTTLLVLLARLRTP